jgi:hypothetical protein
MIASMPRTVTATRYVTPLREGGSLPGLVEADDDGMYVVKFRGAGQGLKALVAELIVGGLAGALGLPVPEMVLVSLDPELGRAEPDPEINELITSSGGLNFGLDFLPGALDFSAAKVDPIEPALAAAIVWFDALTTNVDRTPRNPNLLVWHGRTWLIDHGAALYQHHSPRDLVARAREQFPMIGDHVLLPSASSIIVADEQLAPALTPQAVRHALDEVPDEWLGDQPHGARDMYEQYLSRRLQEPRLFAQEAERARGA